MQMSILLAAAGFAVMLLLRYIELMEKLPAPKAKRLIKSFVFWAPAIAELLAVVIVAAVLASQTQDFKGMAAFFLGAGGRSVLGQLRAVAVQKSTQTLDDIKLGDAPTLRDVS